MKILNGTIVIIIISQLLLVMSGCDHLKMPQGKVMDKTQVTPEQEDQGIALKPAVIKEDDKNEVIASDKIPGGKCYC